MKTITICDIKLSLDMEATIKIEEKYGPFIEFIGSLGSGILMSQIAYVLLFAAQSGDNDELTIKDIYALCNKYASENNLSVYSGAIKILQQLIDAAGYNDNNAGENDGKNIPRAVANQSKA